MRLGGCAGDEGVDAGGDERWRRALAQVAQGGDSIAAEAKSFGVAGRQRCSLKQKGFGIGAGVWNAFGEAAHGVAKAAVGRSGGADAGGDRAVCAFDARQDQIGANHTWHQSGEAGGLVGFSLRLGEPAGRP